MNSSGVTFRQAVIDDIPAIRDLASRIWREHYPGIISHEQIEYMLKRMYARITICDEIENKGYHYILADSGNRTIGFIAFRYDDEDKAVMISKLYLLPAFHGKGFGQRMLEKVKNIADSLQARTIFLYVNKNNRKAIRAYERFGFSKVEAVATDIGGGFIMDDFLMELQI